MPAVKATSRIAKNGPAMCSLSSGPTRGGVEEAAPGERGRHERRRAAERDRGRGDQREAGAEQQLRAVQLAGHEHLGEHLQAEREPEQRVEPQRRERPQAVEDGAEGSGHAVRIVSRPREGFVLRLDDRGVIREEDAGSFPGHRTIGPATDDTRRGGRDRPVP